MSTHLVVTILGGVGFFMLILVSIMLHEVGHYLPARIFKVKILQFFVGFGPNVWKTKKGDIEYGVKAVPLGGYVRLLGMYPPYREGKDTRLMRLADSAREAEWDDITDDDVAAGRLYFQQPIWQRLIIMFGGIFVNLLLAFGLFLGVNMTVGQYLPTMRVDYVKQCLDADEQGVCLVTPAGAMGLKVGDVVVAFNGKEFDRWDKFTAALRANMDKPVQLTVMRDGVRTELPQVRGMIQTVADPDHPGATIQAGYLGVSKSEYANVRVGPIGTIQQMWDMTAVAVKAIAKLPVSAVKVFTDMITGKPRDVNGPISIVGASVIAGDLVSADAPASAKAATYLYLLGSINLFVALLNLVPLPPFDGGHIAAGLFEALRRWLAKLRGREDPGPADTAKLLPVAYVMFGFLIIVGVVFIVADIISPVSLF